MYKTSSCRCKKAVLISATVGLLTEKNITTIQTTNIIAVDLNALLYNLELVIAKARKIKGDEDGLKRIHKTKLINDKQPLIKIAWTQKIRVLHRL
jgi:hypothetical protein